MGGSWEAGYETETYGTGVDSNTVYSKTWNAN
jgi:hypothetical protein